MKLLLIDNYDSYTFNLFQLLARVDGQEPVVLKNDDPRLTEISPGDFDALVLSPGPGRPQRHPDLGWSWELLQRHPELPVLGVCLGHQAIAYQAGARVTEGVARHGYLERVTHDGRDLFAGLPQGFRAVRYHSLEVLDLPAELAACAWARDGTLMGLRHRELARWGVQFHPESVATEHGARLVGNFLALAAARRGCRPPGTPPAYPPPRRSAADTRAGRNARRPGGTTGGSTLDLVVHRLGHELDAERVFEELYAGAARAFWLDSSLVEPGRSRFSFLGDDSGPLGETLYYRVGQPHVEVHRGADVGTEPGGIFAVLEKRARERRTEPGQLPFDLDGGYVGYFGYELKAETGGADAHRGSAPDAAWMFADRLVAIDHEEHATYLVAVCERTEPARDAARRWSRRTAARIEELRPRATGPVEPGPANTAELAGTELGGTELVGVELARPRERYLADIRSCLEELRRGESYEICLTNQLRSAPLADPLGYYRELRRRNPAPYAAFLRLDALTVLGSSPERFLRIDPAGGVETRPIKGTAPRDPDPAVDERRRDALARSAKTRAELLMVVDLLRNDLGQVCEVGSVDVTRFLRTESYATVHQLVSTIVGRLRPEVSPVACARACFPGGSMTGAPKVRTMRIIDRLEGAPRGVYSGALGYFGCGGGADLSIVIRTAVDDGRSLTIGVGGAIVLASDPAGEVEEALLKGRALLAARTALDRQPR